MSSNSGRGARFWIRRYLPSELAGTATAVLAAWLAHAVSGSLLLAAIAGWIIGKLSADLLFFGGGPGYAAGRRRDEARRAAPVTMTTATDDGLLGGDFRVSRICEVRQTFAAADVDALVILHGTPLLVLDTDRVARQYERLCTALPFVGWHYAVKAQSHPAVIATLARIGAAFDVASDCEIDMVSAHGVTADRIIHSQPVKSPTEITRAYVLGIRTFVIDSAGELAKFRHVPANVALLIRLADPNPEAKSDLCTKFGVSAVEAEVLLSQAIAQGNHIAGFSFHVGSRLGSRLDSIEAFVTATSATLELMDRLERQWDVQFTILDIGGGFPVGDRTDVASIEQIASAIRPLLEPRSPHLRIIAEPGRILVAEAATLVSRVMGVRDRDGEAWCFIDDGVHGSYSNVVMEGRQPVILSRAEIDGEASVSVPTTIGGPTCDSADIIARGYPLPRLREGDLLFSPAMGAYTSVTATHFTGRRPAKVVLLERAVTAQHPDSQLLATH